MKARWSTKCSSAHTSKHGFDIARKIWCRRAFCTTSDKFGRSSTSMIHQTWSYLELSSLCRSASSSASALFWIAASSSCIGWQPALFATTISTRPFFMTLLKCKKYCFSVTFPSQYKRYLFFSRSRIPGPTYRAVGKEFFAWHRSYSSQSPVTSRAPVAPWRTYSSSTNGTAPYRP